MAVSFRRKFIRSSRTRAINMLEQMKLQILFLRITIFFFGRSWLAVNSAHTKKMKIPKSVCFQKRKYYYSDHKNPKTDGDSILCIENSSVALALEDTNTNQLSNWDEPQCAGHINWNSDNIINNLIRILVERIASVIKIIVLCIFTFEFYRFIRTGTDKCQCSTEQRTAASTHNKMWGRKHTQSNTRTHSLAHKRAFRLCRQ